ncbi:MAG: nucleotidyltransferase domain-containing protein [Bacteroidaceae bacterium]|nr:nucleotidyltransferase domain-containing protein [Bacteroidaceae bacterium]
MEQTQHLTGFATDRIHSLCRQHKVDKLFVFGSVLTDRFTPQSDVDFAVCFSDISLENYADNYFSLKDGLQEALGRPIDLVEYKAISNPYFLKSIDATKQMIYG